MPKQLKIIVDENYSPDAPFTVNFAAPVIIAPGNKIALDKFTAVINNISSNFTLADTTFQFYYALNDPTLTRQSATVFLPAQKYANIIDLLNALTIGCNNTFTAYLPSGYLPETDPITTERDLGLKILCSVTTNTSTATTNTFQMQYATSDLLPLIMNFPGSMFTPKVGNYYYPNSTGAFAATQSDLLIKYLKGGGCSVQFAFEMPTAQQAIDNVSNWNIGLIDSAGLSHGLFQNSLGQVFLNNAGVKTQVAITNFPVEDNDYYYSCQIYQVSGNFVLRYYSIDKITGIEADVYNSNTLNPGALGVMNYTSSYIFQSDGTMDHVVHNVPAISDEIKMTRDIPMNYVNTEPAFNRIVGFDMSQAGSLRAGLDVPSGLNILNPQNSPAGSFLCQSSINMAIVNSSFDVAIEVLDLPLQTYQASTSRKPGERNNVLCYFHPEFSQVGTGTYIYDSRAYQWLDIDISYPVNLSSLTFRVYDPDTGTGLDALNMSFNLLIGTDEY